MSPLIIERSIEHDKINTRMIALTWQRLQIMAYFSDILRFHEM